MVRQLIKSGIPLTLGVEPRFLTVFFSDLENFSSHSETLAPDEFAVVLDAFPRLDMKRKMKTCFCHLAHAKPATTYESFVRDFGERFVAGYKASSRVDFLMNAPFKE